MKNLMDRSDRSVCPTETLISRYLLHQCPQEERREIENHLTKCPLCRAEVVFLTQAQAEIQDEEKWDELPDQLNDQGMALIKRMSKPTKSRLEIGLEFIREQWQIIRSTGTLISHPTLAVRGESSKRKAPLPSTVVKELDGYKVEVELRQGVRGTVDLQVRVKKAKEGSLLPQTRFTLVDDKKQRILDEFTRCGEISFEGLRPGEYSIKIVQLERLIGDIVLDIRSEMDQ